MKRRIENGYVIYEGETKDDPPEKLDVNFLRFSEKDHLHAIAYELAQERKEWLPFWKEMEITYNFENHLNALIYEHGHTHESIDEKVKEIREEWSRQERAHEMEKEKEEKDKDIGDDYDRE